MHEYAAGYFEAPGAPVCGLGRIAGALAPALPPVSIVFCNMDNMSRMKASNSLGLVHAGLRSNADAWEVCGCGGERRKGGRREGIGGGQMK